MLLSTTYALESLMNSQGILSGLYNDFTNSTFFQKACILYFQYAYCVLCFDALPIRNMRPVLYGRRENCGAKGHAAAELLPEQQRWLILHIFTFPSANPAQGQSHAAPCRHSGVSLSPPSQSRRKKGDKRNKRKSIQNRGKTKETCIARAGPVRPGTAASRAVGQELWV